MERQRRAETQRKECIEAEEEIWVAYKKDMKIHEGWNQLKNKKGLKY